MLSFKQGKHDHAILSMVAEKRHLHLGFFSMFYDLGEALERRRSFLVDYSRDSVSCVEYFSGAVPVMLEELEVFFELRYCEPIIYV